MHEAKIAGPQLPEIIEDDHSKKKHHHSCIMHRCLVAYIIWVSDMPIGILVGKQCCMSKRISEVTSVVYMTYRTKLQLKTWTKRSSGQC